MQNVTAPSRRAAVPFLMVSTFITYIGTGVLLPVLPALVEPYAAPGDRALVIGLLLTSFSLAQFLAAPTLGAVSDRYGRRPVLLLCLLGTALGYLLFGIGGALWVLFLGRVIDGITGGNTSTINAYAADITEEKERTHFYGKLGAVGGIGFLLGPAIGALVYALTHEPLALVYLLAAVSLVNVIWGIFTLPESLPAEARRRTLSVETLNPLTQLGEVFRMEGVRTLLMASFLYGIAYAIIQGNVSYLSTDRLGWTVSETSFGFFLAGVGMVIGQALLVKHLLPRLGEARLAMAGFSLFIVCFLIIAWVATGGASNFMYAALMIGGVGLGLLQPAISGMLSLSVSKQEQGQVQGGSQSMQAMARMIGPVWAGLLYAQLGASAPYLSGITLLIVALWLIGFVVRGEALRHAHGIGD